ncbi:MAG: AAA family ATPase [Chloroflexi bacterium]|nr:AAA family ATPase [Chloroflexota bacterium]
MADSDYRVTAIRLQNFMAFEDTGWIELRPITLLFGRNSSGKSAIIRALLLLKQSMENRDGDSPLALSGPVDFGSFPNLVYGHDVMPGVFFSFRIERDSDPQPPATDAALEVKQGYELLLEKREKTRIAWTKEANVLGDCVELRLLFGTLDDDKGGNNSGNGEQGSMSIRKPRLKQMEIFGYLSPFDIQPVNVFRARYQSTDSTWQFDGDTLSDFWHNGALYSPFRHGLWVSADFELRDGFIPFLTAKFQADDTQKALPDDWRVVVDALDFCGKRIVSLLSRIVYLTPLRDAPRRYYPSETPWVRDLLDEPGELQRETVNKWLSPASMNAKVEPSHLSREEGIAAIYLRQVLGDTTISVNLRDVGSGVAQVLPIIIASLQAKEDGLLIVEQPELHLHPEAQVAMIDLFLELANKGVRVLIETHSEHMLLRLRRRIVEATLERTTGSAKLPQPISELPDPSDVIILHVDRDGTHSTVETIGIDSYGQFVNPSPTFEAFFDRAYQDLKSLTVISAQIRQLESGNVRRS